MKTDQNSPFEFPATVRGVVDVIVDVMFQEKAWNFAMCICASAFECNESFFVEKRITGTEQVASPPVARSCAFSVLTTPLRYTTEGYIQGDNLMGTCSHKRTWYISDGCKSTNELLLFGVP